MKKFVQEKLREKSMLTEPKDIDFQEQRKYISEVLSELGVGNEVLTYKEDKYIKKKPKNNTKKTILSILGMFGKKKKEAKESEDMLKDVEIFFYALTDILNTFIISKKDVHLSDIKEIFIITKGEEEQEKTKLVACYVDNNKTPNTVKLDLKRIHSSGLIRVKDLTNEKSWNEKNYLLFEEEYPMGESDEFYDKIIYSELVSFSREWVKQMIFMNQMKKNSNFK